MAAPLAERAFVQDEEGGGISRPELKDVSLSDEQRKQAAAYIALGEHGLVSMTAYVDFLMTQPSTPQEKLESAQTVLGVIASEVVIEAEDNIIGRPSISGRLVGGRDGTIEYF